MSPMAPYLSLRATHCSITRLDKKENGGGGGTTYVMLTLFPSRLKMSFDGFPLKATRVLDLINDNNEEHNSNQTTPAGLFYFRRFWKQVKTKGTASGHKTRNP